MFRLIKVLIFLASSYEIVADIALNSRCTMNDRTTIGVCLKVVDCPSVLRHLNAGTIRANPPSICSNIERTVCCPQSIQQQPITNYAANSTIIPRPLRVSERSK